MVLDDVAVWSTVFHNIVSLILETENYITFYSGSDLELCIYRNVIQTFVNSRRKKTKSFLNLPWKACGKASDPD